MELIRRLRILEVGKNYSDQKKYSTQHFLPVGCKIMLLISHLLLIENVIFGIKKN